MKWPEIREKTVLAVYCAFLLWVCKNAGKRRRLSTTISAYVILIMLSVLNWWLDQRSGNS